MTAKTRYRVSKTWRALANGEEKVDVRRLSLPTSKHQRDALLALTVTDWQGDDGVGDAMDALFGSQGPEEQRLRRVAVGLMTVLAMQATVAPRRRVLGLEALAALAWFDDAPQVAGTILADAVAQNGGQLPTLGKLVAVALASNLRPEYLTAREGHALVDEAEAFLRDRVDGDDAAQ